MGGQGLGAYALFAGVLAAAGLPIYIHAPKYYVDEFGVSLAALGAVLFGLRLLDVVQDPLLGKLSVRVAGYRGTAVTLALVIMGGAMVGLFAIPPLGSPLVWFALMLTLVFSAFSFLTINFYARGVSKAEAMGPAGHLSVARWRETGALVGVCIASILPALFLAIGFPEFAGFACVFALACLCAGILMRREWVAGNISGGGQGFRVILDDPIARRLLLIALVNAAPVAVSSTLFLFFVESRLDAPGWEGPLLLLFFLAAAAAAPIWSFAAERFGAKPALLIAMVLAVIAFSFAMTLASGDAVWFGVICLASGAAVGADLTLLPAIFARRLEQIAPDASEGFALWAFVSKFTLAFAAIALLPVLESSGFASGSNNDETALWVLTLLYAGIPCVLKLVAIGLLLMTPIEKD